MGKFRRTIRPYIIFIPGILMFLLSAIVVLYGIVPAISRIRESWESMKTISVEVSDLRKRVTFLQSLDARTLEDQLQKLASAVPAEPQIGSSFVTVETLARDSGATLVDLSLEGPGLLSTDAGTLTSVKEALTESFTSPMSVSLQGTLDQLKTFLSKAVSVRRFLRVDTVAFLFAKPETSIASGSASLAGSSTIQIDATLHAFYVPLPRTLDSVSSSLTPLSDQAEAFLGSVSSMPLLSGQLSSGGSGAVGAKTNPFAK